MPATPTSTQPKPKTILLIDDDLMIASVVKLRLEEADGFHVEVATDGPDGLRQAAAHRPDLILLDWQMPGMDGIEVLRTLKADKETADIPVIMLTGKGTMGDVEVALAFGAVGYVAKPVQFDELSKRVAKYRGD